MGTAVARASPQLYLRAGLAHVRTPRTFSKPPTVKLNYTSHHKHNLANITGGGLLRTIIYKSVKS
jgi:hypothetical protein